jgi:hypothetical protein
MRILLGSLQADHLSLVYQGIDQTRLLAEVKEASVEGVAGIQPPRVKDHLNITLLLM